MSDFPSEVPPVFIIGPHRSGTTWLGSLLSRVPGTAYWSEPRQVWVYGNWDKPDDRLLAEDATDRIKRHIRRRFATYTRQHGGRRFCEKTPSNCLRVPFMHAVFPEGKFVLLIRDGRAVFRSTDEIQSKGADWNRIWARVRESSWREFPAYLDRIPWIWRKLTGRRLDFWGVRPPGWREWAQELTPAQVIARQWADSISIAYDSFQQLPESQRLIIRYEELVADPERELTRLADFAQIESAEQLIQAGCQTARPQSNQKWRDELSPELLEEIRPILLPTLQKLGYEW